MPTEGEQRVWSSDGAWKEVASAPKGDIAENDFF
jgi:hypothetical protein